MEIEILDLLLLLFDLYDLCTLNSKKISLSMIGTLSIFRNLFLKLKKKIYITIKLTKYRLLF